MEALAGVILSLIILSLCTAVALRKRRNMKERISHMQVFANPFEIIQDGDSRTPWKKRK